MQSMTQAEVPLVVGEVDAHADVHHYATLDSVGTLLGSKAFPASTRGYADALEWLRAFGQLDAIAVESTGSYAAGLVRYLRRHDIEIREVNQPHPHSRRRVGKSDPIDDDPTLSLSIGRLLAAGVGGNAVKAWVGDKSFYQGGIGCDPDPVGIDVVGDAPGVVGRPDECGLVGRRSSREEFRCPVPCVRQRTVKQEI